MTPNEMAQKLGIDPKALRRWLRQEWPPEEPKSRWVLSPEQQAAAERRFGRHDAATANDGPAAMGLAAESSEQSDDWSSWYPLDEAIPMAPLSPGVYMARQGPHGPVVYVGMAGERRGQGIRGRLNIYLSGKGLASGLGEAVFDRALADVDWLSQRLSEVQSGAPMRAKMWGRAALDWAGLQVRWQVTADRASALALELHVMRALPQEPLWNRYR